MIDQSIRQPGSYSRISGSSGANALPTGAQELIFIAQRLAAGTVAAGIPTRVYTPEEASSFFGAGSVLHRMAIAAFRKNPYIMLSCCALDDSGTGVAAASTITFSTNVSASGVMSLLIGIDRITIAAEKGKTPAEIAALFAAEVNKFPALPVTATANLAVLTLTAKNKGTCGNLIGKYNSVTSKHEPEIRSTAGGMTAAVTGFTAGANAPSMATALAAVAGYRYHLYVIPFIDSTAVGALDEHLELVSDERNQKGARGFVFVSQALADATTLAAVNAKRITIGFIRKVKRASYENAAAYAAMQAGMPSPWLPLNDEELTGCDASDVKDRLGDTEIEVCLANGVTPFYVGAGERVRCVRSISTYTVDSADTPDITYLDFLKIGTADYVRDAVNQTQRRQFGKAVLRETHVDGEPDYIATPDDVRSCNIAVCKRIEQAGGLNNVEKYKDLFTSVMNPNVPGRVDSKIPIDIVDALHILANDISIVSRF